MAYYDDEEDVKTDDYLNEDSPEKAPGGSFGSFQIRPPRRLLTDLSAKKKNKTAMEKVQQTGQAITDEMTNREKLRGQYNQQINAPVAPENWYTRLLKGAFFGLSNRQPGESIAESLGRGVGYGVASAAYKPAYQEEFKTRRDAKITGDYQKQKGISDERLQDLLAQRKLSETEQKETLDQTKEERLFQRGIDQYDLGEGKLKQGAEKLEQDKAKLEESKRQFGITSAERERHNQAQEDLSQQRVQATTDRNDEFERHNKAMEDKHGAANLEEYTLQFVGPHGDVKLQRIKVPKGENPLDHVKKIVSENPNKYKFPTENPRPGQTTVTPQATPAAPVAPSPTPKDIGDRNKGALDKLKVRDANAKGNLDRLLH